ncbi:MAG: pilus assembly protein TadG-related protein, partial [Candidatus Palauibacterales bacterium]|nr:pilus assembly protein TadG-related protein [Candidatus Palauibacterales bacterium]
MTARGGTSLLLTRLREERGASLAIVAVGMVVFLAGAAISVDLGMLFVAHGQAQRAADASALAGAGWLVTVPGDTTGARQAAIHYAARNDILGDSVVVRPGDVTFPENNKIRVWVYRTKSRNDPVPTIFARVLGVDVVDVAVKAAAKLWPAGAVDCVLPIMLPDRWEELGGNPDFFDQGIDNYIPWLAPDGSVNSGYTGYSENDYGTQVVIRQVSG